MLYLCFNWMREVKNKDNIDIRLKQKLIAKVLAQPAENKQHFSRQKNAICRTGISLKFQVVLCLND